MSLVSGRRRRSSSLRQAAVRVLPLALSLAGDSQARISSTACPDPARTPTLASCRSVDVRWPQIHVRSPRFRNNCPLGTLVPHAATRNAFRYNSPDDRLKAQPTTGDCLMTTSLQVTTGPTRHRRPATCRRKNGSGNLLAGIPRRVVGGTVSGAHRNSELTLRDSNYLSSSSGVHPGGIR